MIRHSLSPVARRIVYALLFEGLGVAITTLGLLAFSHADAATAGGAAFGSTLIALLWNYVFNAIFEAWERRQSVKGRSLRRRLAHGVLYEGGLILLMVPFLAWWLQTGLIEALVYDLALVAFFGVYAFVFTWGLTRCSACPLRPLKPREGLHPGPPSV